MMIYPSIYPENASAMARQLGINMNVVLNGLVLIVPLNR